METILARELAAIVIGCVVAGGLHQAPLLDQYKQGAILGVVGLTVFAMARIAGFI